MLIGIGGKIAQSVHARGKRDFRLNACKDSYFATFYAENRDIKAQHQYDETANYFERSELSMHSIAN
jgi:hypothetical protein